MQIDIDGSYDKPKPGSYDRPKLLQLLERNRGARLMLRDATDRQTKARETVARLAAVMRSNGGSVGAHDAAERLLKLSLVEALKVPGPDVEAYADARNGRRKTGISFDTWQRYLDAREQLERMSAAAQGMQASVDAEFAIVPNLVDAVRQWGFKNPELEV